MLTDGRTTDARVTGILIAHLGAFGSGELKRLKAGQQTKVVFLSIQKHSVYISASCSVVQHGDSVLYLYGSPIQLLWTQNSLAFYL